MRIKRILTTLLVALMMFSLVAVAAAAEEEKVTSFDINVEAVKGSTALSDGVFCNTEDGIELDFVLNIKSNPGVYLLTFNIVYDAEKLEFVSATNGTVIVNTDKGDLVRIEEVAPGTVKALCMSANGDVKTVDAALASVKFKVIGECFDSSVNSFKVEGMEFV